MRRARLVEARARPLRVRHGREVVVAVAVDGRPHARRRHRRREEEPALRTLQRQVPGRRGVRVRVPRLAGPRAAQEQPPVVGPLRVVQQIEEVVLKILRHGVVRQQLGRRRADRGVEDVERRVVRVRRAVAQVVREFEVDAARVVDAVPVARLERRRRPGAARHGVLAQALEHDRRPAVRLEAFPEGGAVELGKVAHAPHRGALGRGAEGARRVRQEVRPVEDVAEEPRGRPRPRPVGATASRRDDRRAPRPAPRRQQAAVAAAEAARLPELVEAREGAQNPRRARERRQGRFVEVLQRGDDERVVEARDDAEARAPKRRRGDAHALGLDEELALRLDALRVRWDKGFVEHRSRDVECEHHRLRFDR